MKGKGEQVHLCAANLPGAGSGLSPQLSQGLQRGVELARLLLVPGSCFSVHVDAVLPQLVSLALVLAAPMSLCSGRLVCYCWR